MRRAQFDLSVGWGFNPHWLRTIPLLLVTVKFDLGIGFDPLLRKVKNPNLSLIAINECQTLFRPIHKISFCNGL